MDRKLLEKRIKDLKLIEKRISTAFGLLKDIPKFNGRSKLVDSICDASNYINAARRNLEMDLAEFED